MVCRFLSYVFSTISAYADDFHAAWVIRSALQFKNACLQIWQNPGRSSVSRYEYLAREDGHTYVNKGVRIRAARRRLGWIHHTKHGRHLVIPTAGGDKLLPIRSEHHYLGVVISYKAFERSTMQYRIQQSWSAFHRLYRFLVSKSLPIADRPRLWRTCVQTVLFYGLPAIQLDARCCSALRTHVIKQLRSIARSPAHITHESNDAIRHRLRVTDVIEQITSATQARLAKARQHLADLQPLNVQQYWGTLEADGVSRSLKQHASICTIRN